MSIQHARQVSRRRFLRGVRLVGTAGLLGLYPRPVTAQPPPETTKLRVTLGPSICQAPVSVAEELLRGEGFSDLTYVKQVTGVGSYKALAAGEADIAIQFSGPNLIRVDQ